MQKRPYSKALWTVLRGHGTCVPMRPCAASKGSSAAENSVPKYLRSTAVRYFYTAHSTVLASTKSTPRCTKKVPKQYQNSTKGTLPSCYKDSLFAAYQVPTCPNPHLSWLSIFHLVQCLVFGTHALRQKLQK